MYSQLTKALLW